MPDVPLPRGIKGLSTVPKQQEELVNLYWTPEGIFRTPGIEALATVGDTISQVGCRGAAQWYADGHAYFVVGSRLYRLLNGTAITDMGAIAGTGACIFSPGQTMLVIIVIGGPGYVISSAFGVLVEITDPDFLPSSSVDFIDGRHVFIPTDGSPAFYSDIDVSSSISPLSFFDAEELPDINRYTINVADQLYIMGDQSGQIFRTTGDVNAPFESREGSRIDVGYVAGGVRYKGTFAFIGKRRDQSYTFCLMAAGDAPSISNSRVDEILRSFTEAQIRSATVDAFEWNKTTFIVWTIESLSLAFVDGEWIYMDSDLNGTEAGPWRARGIVFCNGSYHVADAVTGQLGVLSDAPGEYENNVEWWLQTFARGERGSEFSVEALEVDVLTGQGAETIGLSVSADARIWSDFHYLSLGEIGEYDRRIQWGGGLGQYENCMGITLRGTGQVQIALESLRIDA